MKANPEFLTLPLEFWANVKFVSQEVGYTDYGTKRVKVFTLENILKVFKRNGLKTDGLVTKSGSPTSLASQIIDYSKFRAEFLEQGVKPNLMLMAEAKALFYNLREELGPKCHLPMNKQKQEKKDFAFLTGIVNMIIESNINGLPIDYNPRLLTSIARGGMPVRTLSRWVDGAFPSTINPIAIWEIKEYYYTTTFGSRVADGVYETQLDGYELAEIRKTLGIDVEHYLIVDDYRTWWEMGRSYLCRICDMMHMGTLTEALFGKEVVDRLPTIVAQWTRKHPIEPVIIKSSEETQQDFEATV